MDFQIRGTGREARHEDREDNVSPFKVSGFDLLGCCTEDETDATVCVCEDFLLGGGGDAALVGEHAGSGVDCCGVVEEHCLNELPVRGASNIVKGGGGLHSQRQNVPCPAMKHLLVIQGQGVQDTTVARTNAFQPAAALR